MTTPNRILVDLRAGQATTSALSETIRVPELVIQSMCARHEKDGLVVASKIAETLTVWRLTHLGNQTAEALATAQGGAKHGTPNIAR